MKALFSLLCSGLLSTLFAQPVTVDRDSFAADLLGLQRALEIYHPNPYYYRDSATVSAFRLRLLTDFPEDCRPVDAYRAAHQFVNFFNDGHTRLYDPKILETARAEATFLPLAVAVNGSRLTVSRHLDDAVGPDLQKMDILSINGTPAQALIPLLRRHASRETDELDDALLSRSFPYYLWLATGWTGSFRIEVNGMTAPLILPGRVYTDLYPRTTIAQRSPAISYEILEDGSAYLRVRRFHGMGRRGFRRAYAAAFDHFRRRGATRRLIVDVRDHDGGDHRFGVDLARYLADEEFRDFSYSEWKATPAFKRVFKNVYVPRGLHWAVPVLKGFHPHLKAIYGAEDHAIARVAYRDPSAMPKAKRYPGEVIVLTNENTFSAGTTFMALVKDNKLATIVGGPSGNVANFHADALLRYTLPHLGSTLHISTSFLVRPSGETAHEPVWPDVLLERDEDALQYLLSGKFPVSR